MGILPLVVNCDTECLHECPRIYRGHIRGFEDDSGEHQDNHACLTMCQKLQHAQRENIRMHNETRRLESGLQDQRWFSHNETHRLESELLDQRWISGLMALFGVGAYVHWRQLGKMCWCRTKSALA